MSIKIESNSLNVIVADDHPLFIYALTETIKKNQYIKKIVPAKNGLEVLELLKRSKYDLVFLDVSMPEMDGEETAFYILHEYPDVKTIAISMHDSPTKIKQMYMAGCKSYILKVQDEVEILKSLSEVIAGNKYFNNLVVDKLALNEDEEKKMGLQKAYKLSPMEIRVIVLVSEGKKSKEIGEILKRSPRTIEKYREFIYKKTATTNAVELHSFAQKHHLITK